jgi:hypothetical protein
LGAKCAARPEAFSSAVFSLYELEQHNVTAPGIYQPKFVYAVRLVNLFLFDAVSVSCGRR